MSINIITNTFFVFLQFNLNGLKHHINERETVLYNKRIDIVLLTKTYFFKYSSIYIPGFELLKTNHTDNTAYGEYAILIKSSTIFQPFLYFCQPY